MTVSGTPGAIEAVLCDLDDTLYPQSAWLDGAWRAVAAAAARHGIDEAAFLAALQADAALGTARGGIIDRALASSGVAAAPNTAAAAGASGGAPASSGVATAPRTAAATAEPGAEPASSGVATAPRTAAATAEPGVEPASSGVASAPKAGASGDAPASSSVATAPRTAAAATAASGIGLATAPSAAALLPHLVAVFRAHRPGRLEPYPGVRAALARLRGAGVRVGVVTDGDVDVQAWKVRALGLSAFFDCVVVSDSLGGRSVRKPHAAPFLAALGALGVEGGRCVFVGDRPEKDVTGALGVGVRAVRVKTGEYSQVPDVAGTWYSAADFADAVEWLLLPGK